MSLPRYPEYKDSGVEWLGSVPAHWEVDALRRRAALNPSKAEVRAVETEKFVSFLPMEAVGERGDLDLSRTRRVSEVLAGYTYFREGDIAFAKITPCFENGKGARMVGLRGGVGFGTTELTVVRPDPDLLDGHYLDWVLRSVPFRKRGEAAMYGAGGQKRVPDEFVREFVIGWPDIREQSLIAKFLDRETGRIDALIAEQEKLLALLAEKRQATISHAVTRGLDPNAPMKDSGIAWLGEVPAHWDVVTLRRVVETFEQGWSPDCESRTPELGEWGVLKAGCVNGGVFSATESKALPVALSPRPELEVRGGDVLMSRASGSPKLIGSVALLEEVPPRLMLSDKVFRLRLSSTVIPRFFALSMGSTLMRRQIEVAIGGAEGLANNLPQSSIKQFWLALPPRSEQERIVASLGAETLHLDKMRGAAEQAVVLLKERRSALISAAVTGQVDVRGLVEMETA